MNESSQPKPEHKFSEKISPFRNGGDFERPGFDGQILVDGSENRGFSSLIVQVHGEHPPKRMLEDTTRTYFVLEGSGSFTLDGVRQAVGKGELVVIEPGGEYQYEGDMSLLETNISATNIFKDLKL
jgi:mannose-6-phosphate isomerase-like protein (cupin superfamily)